MELNQILILQGKTRHGKNRVNEQGALWRIVGIRPALPHSRFPVGTMTLELESVEGNHWRIISANGDQDFEFFPAD